MMNPLPLNLLRNLWMSPYQIQSDKIVWRVKKKWLNFIVRELEKNEFVIRFYQKNTVRIHSQDDVVA